MSTISSGTTSTTTLIHSGDTTGSLVFKTNDTGSGGTTAVTIDTSQNATFAGKVTSAGALTLASNGSTTAVTIDTSQNVGIGTTSPAAKFHSAGGVIATGSASAFTATAGIVDTSGGNVRLTATGADASTYGVMTFNRGSSNASLFQENMRIDSSGNVGIGTSSPTATLHVRPTTDVNLRVTNSSSALNLSAENNAGSAQVAMKFNGSQMMLDSSGNLLMSYSSRTSARGLVDIPTVGGSSSVCMGISRGGDAGTMVNFYSTNSSTTVIGSIGNSGNTNTTYNTSSDYRLKDNVLPMTGALERVVALKPVTWKWKSTGADGQGFIAHELAEICPDAVTGTKDEVDAENNPVYQGVDTSYLVATLTAALQELKAINDQQAQTITALTARIVALEEK